MCKVFAMTNTTQFKVNAKFVSIVRNEVCRHADQDGFGYAMVSEKGDIGGERTMRPLNFRPLIDPESPKTTKKLPIVLDADSRFGKIDLEKAKSFIAHGRLSTNTVSLPNTHPFTSDGLALIHNGVVRDPTDGVKKVLTSTCDSEILLRYFERGGVEAIEKMVTGYYAVAVLDKGGMLHIMRDDRADLYISYCRTVDSFIIATTAEIIRNVAKEMKWKVEHPEEILEKTYTMFDSNVIKTHRSITPRTSEYGGSYGTNYGGHDYSGSQGEFRGNGYTTYENGKKTTDGASSASKSVVSGSSATEGSSTKEFSGSMPFQETDASKELVPKYRELPGRVVPEGSSSSTAASSSEDTDEAVHSLGNGMHVRLGPDEETSYEGRIDAIVEEVEGWRNGRAESDI